MANSTLLAWKKRRGALIIAHPGHELRVHRWLEIARPAVFVFTDGSGRTAQSRLASTTAVINSSAARPGSIYGRWTDREIYELILAGNVRPLAAAARELAAALRAEVLDYVVADAIEGYNPSHDLCRHIVNAAVALVEKAEGRTLANYDFLLVGRPDECPEDLRGEAIRVDLDEAALERKLAAAENYHELKAEVETIRRQFGTAPFLTEYLRPASVDLSGHSSAIPYYESFGEKQVAAGFYEHVIRYASHMRPLVRALWKELHLPWPPS